MFKNEKEFIILYTQSGLGNRMESLESAILLARKLNRKLYVIWPNAHSHNLNYEDVFEMSDAFELINVNTSFLGIKFRISYPYAMSHTSKRGWVRGIIVVRAALNVALSVVVVPPYRVLKFLLRKLNLSRFLLPRTVPTSVRRRLEEWKFRHLVYSKKLDRVLVPYGPRDKSLHDGKVVADDEQLLPDILKNSKRVLIDSYWRFYPRKIELDQNSLPPLDIEFKLNSELRTRVDKITKRFDTRTVGIHIRHSYLYLKRPQANVSGIHSFISLMEKEIENDPSVKFFVATDSSEIHQELERLFKERIIRQHTTTEVGNWYDSAEATKDGVVDMFALAATNKVYGTYGSSFSRVAARMGKIEYQWVYVTSSFQWAYNPDSSKQNKPKETDL